jgi:hypothetical protein
MNLNPRLSRDGNLTKLPKGWRLAIPAGPASRYRLSQLDDHAAMPRHAYLWHPPLGLSLRARVSSASLPGTWGFGLWNDPYGFSFGPGDVFLRLPALPNAIWFFHSSERSYLSFRDDKPAQGFLAQAFHSPNFHPLLIPAGLILPFSRRRMRPLLRRVIEEDSVKLELNVTQWHEYRMAWNQERTKFWVDEELVLDSPVSPRPPLGLVVWIDNQYAAFTPQGKLRMGMEKNPEGAWLEVENVEVKS